MDYNQLKQRQRVERENYPTNLSLRLHRALSCVNCTEFCQNDLDGQFIFLWIAINAAYAQDLECLNLSEIVTFSQFVSEICNLNQNSHDNSLNRQRNSTRPTLLWQTNTPVKSSNWF
jgi:hypothetical protein